MAKGFKTGGRQPGSLNKVTADLKKLAVVHTEEALTTIVKLMKSGESDTVRLSAAKELLDRAHGKAAQAVKVGGDEDAPPISFQQIVRKIIDDPDH